MDGRIQRNRSVGRPDPVAFTRNYYADYPFPSHFPAYSKVLTTSAGYVWVERFPEPYTEDPGHWKVFAPDGSAVVATVAVPRHLDLMWVGETHVAGVARDELGVQTVEVRPIERGR